MVIQKHFYKQSKADNYKLDLYSKYSSVKLINYPRFGQIGLYSFKVSSKIKQNSSR